jgi:BASS family bile acid:Na+ symporter
MDSTSNLILNGALILLMFGMGLALVIDDFTRIFKEPKAILLGLVNQIIFLPLIAYLIIFLIPVPIEIAIGLMIIAACPGGPTSNLISHLAKADIALSVSLTAISSTLSIFTIPIVVNIAFQALTQVGQTIELDTLDTISKIFSVLILPVVAGMTVRVASPNFAKRMQASVRIASAILLSLIIVGLLIKEKEHLAAWFEAAGITALLLNFLSMTVAYYSARLFKIGNKQSFTISVEAGIQNGTLAMAIAISLIGNSAYAVSPAIYALLMFVSGAAIIWLANRRKENST